MIQLIWASFWAGGLTSGWHKCQVWRELNMWLRDEVRAMQLKQWKRGKTMYRELTALGAKTDMARRVKQPTLVA